MPTLEWIGKDKVVNHDKEVPFRLLKEVRGKSLNGDDSENMIIHGDNLEALKALLPHYAGKVKMIYIDPPYNTGNEGWVYNDRVNSPQMKSWLGKVVGGESDDLCRHDKWLCMMYPRLKVLRELLSDEGLIFISIDYHEQHHLNTVLNEIFGVNNYLGHLIWRGMHTVRNSAKDFNKNTEYVFCYSKMIDNLIIAGKRDTYLRSPMDKSSSYTKDDNDGRGPYKLDPISARNFYTPYEVKFPNGVKWEAPKGSYPRYSKENLLDMYEDNKLDFNGKEPRAKRYLKEVQKGIPPSTLLPNKEVGFNKDGTSLLSLIFPEIKAFDQPKPTQLIEYLFRIQREIDNNDGVYLDSFAGSGTTAHAVLNLNKEDGGNRKFILVEMEDYADTITAERVRRVIKGYGNGNNKVEGTGGGFKYMELSEEPLFDRHGVISTKATYGDLANYIFFTETHNSIDRKKEKPKEGYLGEKGGVHYFLIFDGFPDLVFKNYLTEEFLETLDKFDGKKVVYADAVLLDDETLRERGIEFKQIPYEIKTF